MGGLRVSKAKQRLGKAHIVAEGDFPNKAETIITIAMLVSGVLSKCLLSFRSIIPKTP